MDWGPSDFKKKDGAWRLPTFFKLFQGYFVFPIFSWRLHGESASVITQRWFTTEVLRITCVPLFFTSPSLICRLLTPQSRSSCLITQVPEGAERMSMSELQCLVFLFLSCLFIFRFWILLEFSTKLINGHNLLTSYQKWF